MSQQLPKISGQFRGHQRKETVASHQRAVSSPPMGRFHGRRHPICRADSRNTARSRTGANAASTVESDRGRIAAVRARCRLAIRRRRIPALPAATRPGAASTRRCRRPVVLIGRHRQVQLEEEFPHPRGPATPSTVRAVGPVPTPLASRQAFKCATRPQGRGQ